MYWLALISTTYIVLSCYTFSTYKFTCHVIPIVYHSMWKRVETNSFVCTWFHYLVWISSCFMGDIGYIKYFVQSKSSLLFSILHKIIMSKRCRRYSNVGRFFRVAFHMANPLILALVLNFSSEHFLWCACFSLWLGGIYWWEHYFCPCNWNIYFISPVILFALFTTFCWTIFC